MLSRGLSTYLGPAMLDHCLSWCLEGSDERSSFVKKLETGTAIIVRKTLFEGCNVLYKAGNTFKVARRQSDRDRDNFWPCCPILLYATHLDFKRLRQFL